MKNIGILGGSFNPFHNGHLEIAKLSYEKFKIDEVWIIPTYISPHKKDNFDSSHKLKIIESYLNFYSYAWLKINKYELNSKEISYTYKTLKYFKEKFKNYNFFLIIGDDQYDNFKTWNNYLYILNNFKIIVANRINNDLSIYNKNFLPLDNKIIKCSSSEIREGNNFDCLINDAKDYIFKNKLYLEDILKSNLSVNKYEHCIDVANRARKIANKINTDPEKAYYAGLLHDLSKEWSEDRLNKYLGFLRRKMPTKIKHGFSAANWLRKNYSIFSEDILIAIQKHTSPYGKLTILDKIIYIADKMTDNNLKDFSIDKIDLIFFKYLNLEIKILENKGVKISKGTLKLYGKQHK